MGNIVQKGDTVKRMEFSGKMPDKYVSYWSAIGDVEYQKTQWVDAKRVRIEGRGY